MWDLDLGLRKVQRFHPVLLHEKCTVLALTWAEGPVGKSGHESGTGVGDTVQLWLTVSQYVEWGNMRCWYYWSSSSSSSSSSCSDDSCDAFSSLS